MYSRYVRILLFEDIADSVNCPGCTEYLLVVEKKRRDCSDRPAARTINARIMQRPNLANSGR